MALRTQIIRNDEPMSLNWGIWHVSVMMEAAQIEEELPWQHTTLATTGRQELNAHHSFIDESDGEVLNLKPGDVLTMYR